MMALGHWVDELHLNYALDETTGYIASLRHCARVPPKVTTDEDVKAFVTKLGTDIGNYIKDNLLAKLLEKLKSKRVGGHPQQQIYQGGLEQRYSDPIYRICCRL